MSFSLTETDDSMESLKLMDTEYSIESDGHRYNEPIVHCFCRDGDGERVVREVEGFHPHFYIKASEFIEKIEQVLNGNTIRRVEVPESAMPSDKVYGSFIQPLEDVPETLFDEPVVKIVTIEPSHVSDLRDYFEDTFEGDVFFNYRFLISNEIYQGIKVPAGKDRIMVEEIEPTDQIPDISPKLCTVDIEVWSGDGFPEPEYAEHPITSIVAHDNYSDEYVGWMLRPWKEDNEWDEDNPDWETPDGVSDSQFEAEVFDDEGEMLQDFIDYIQEVNPDLLSGWNSSPNDNGQGFDYPYIINRCKKINVWGIEDLSPMGQTFVTSRGTPVAKGRQMFDMLQAYKKTQIHKKRSYSLDYISKDELGYGKEEVLGFDEGWLKEPVQFMRYNIRDVQAVTEIEQSKSILEMYDHIRSIAGASYSDISDSNIGIIDPLFLREAYDRNIVLPTSTMPAVKHYHGAYVFDPDAGKHTNVVYPDLSSLYPNLLRNMNASPETLVGFEDDLRESEYTEDECIEMFVDPRGEEVKKEDDSGIERVSFYVLKPSVKESFIRDVVGDLIDMKYEYKKDEYPDEQYGAVKRITNSVYGVLGDSDTYGTGFRLFDWRIAEAITLAGRDVIKYTADTFESRVRKLGYGDASIIYGDTDSCVCSIPSADGSWEQSSLDESRKRELLEEAELDYDKWHDTAMGETLAVSMESAEYVDSTYPSYMSDRFNMEEQDMAVEIESYAKSMFLRSKKKRYAEWIWWDEGDIEKEIELTGLEAVRSDSSNMTERTQGEMLRILLTSDNEYEDVTSYLKKERQRIIDGEISLENLGVPKAISKGPQEYGWKENEDGSYKFWTASPHIRGIRYSNAHIDGEHIAGGDKPLFFYLDGVDCECSEDSESLSLGDSSSKKHPSVFQYDISLNVPPNVEQEVCELGEEVDAISLEDVSNMPSCANVDYDTMEEKYLKKPSEKILQDMGWSWEDVTSNSSQTGLSSFM